MSAEAVYASLGIPDGKKIEGMTEYRDKYREYGRWDTSVEATNFWANITADRKESTELSWHQVVGIHFASSLMVTREPFFLFDTIEVSKTSQSAGVVMMRPWLRRFFKLYD